MPGLDAPDPDVPGLPCIPHSLDPGLDAVPGRLPQLVAVPGRDRDPALAAVPGLEKALTLFAVPGRDEFADLSAAPKEFDLASEFAVVGRDESFDTPPLDADVPGLGGHPRLTVDVDVPGRADVPVDGLDGKNSEPLWTPSPSPCRGSSATSMDRSPVTVSLVITASGSSIPTAAYLIPSVTMESSSTPSSPPLPLASASVSPFRLSSTAASIPSPPSMNTAPTR